MTTVATHLTIAEWCATARHMHERGQTDAAELAETFPQKALWTQQTTVYVEDYPALSVEFSAGVKVGDVRVDAGQTWTVYADATATAHGAFLAGDVETEETSVAVTSGCPYDNGIFTTESAHDLVTAMGELLIHVAADNNGVVPPVVFRNRAEVR